MLATFWASLCLFFWSEARFWLVGRDDVTKKSVLIGCSDSWNGRGSFLSCMGEAHWATRWWSLHQLHVSCLDKLDLFPAFLLDANDDGLCKASVAKLRAIFDCRSSVMLLTCELAIIVDSLSIFAETTVKLQSTTAVCSTTYDYIRVIESTIDDACHG